MNQMKTIFLSAVCLVITSSLYAAQPILPQLAADFHSSLPRMGNLMTLILLGNGLAQALVIPLGDRFERRSLTQIFLLLGVAANLTMAFSSSMKTALTGGLLIGIYSCSNMLILAYAAGIAESGRKGRVTASVMGGVLSGILLSRTASGVITAFYSWRMIYLAIALCLGASFLVFSFFPKSENQSGEPICYSKLLLSVIRLIRRENGLRKRMISGMSGFLVFNFLWTGLTFLLSASPFRFDGFTIGLFGLAGVSGILASKRIGGLFDRGLGERVLLYAWIVLAISWAILMGASAVSHFSLPCAVILLVVGIILLDGAMQSQHITNQTFLLSSHEQEQSRALTAYMSCNLLMGSVSNLILSACYSHIHWIGICAISIVICLVNLFIQQWRVAAKG